MYKILTIFLILLTFFLSLSSSFQNSFYLFLLVFSLFYWQRQRLQDFFQKIKNPKIASIIYLLTGWVWTLFLELNCGHRPFHPQPIANLIVGAGFYLPYFAIWLALVRRYQFTFLEVFYLGGLGRIIFDLLVTRKILTSAAATTSALATFLAVVVQTIVTLVLFGALTTLPTFYFKDPENKEHSKPLKHYLLGLTPNFLATGVFIVWVIVLKIIFT